LLIVTINRKSKKNIVENLRKLEWIILEVILKGEFCDAKFIETKKVNENIDFRALKTFLWRRSSQKRTQN